MKYRMPLREWVEKAEKSRPISYSIAIQSKSDDLADHLLLDHLQKLPRNAYQQVLVNTRNSNKEIIFIPLFDTLPNHILQ